MAGTKDVSCKANELHVFVFHYLATDTCSQVRDVKQRQHPLTHTRDRLPNVKNVNLICKTNTLLLFAELIITSSGHEIITISHA